MKKNHTHTTKLHTSSNALTRTGTDFLICGFAGLLTEICFTALNSLKRRDLRLKGTTSLWMFPIYGIGALIPPAARFLQQKKTPVLARGILYTCCIFAAEYLSGRKLRQKRCCPWDYHRAHFHINGLIRIDYAPLWFLFGIGMEHLLPHLHRTPKNPLRAK